MKALCELSTRQGSSGLSLMQNSSIIHLWNTLRTTCYN